MASFNDDDLLEWPFRCCRTAPCGCVFRFVWWVAFSPRIFFLNQAILHGCQILPFPAKKYDIVKNFFKRKKKRLSELTWKYFIKCSWAAILGLMSASSIGNLHLGRGFSPRHIVRIHILNLSPERPPCTKVRRKCRSVASSTRTRQHL
jgi:hypothetical protein